MVDSSTERRLALVTGASSGIGEAFARAYAARGWDLALVARRRDRLEALAAELTAAHGVACQVIAADLAAWKAEETVLAALTRPVDALVNNAGFGIAEDFIDVPWDRQRDFLMTLVVSAVGLAHGVIPGMVAKGGGSVITVASLVAFSPGAAGHTLYPAAKSLAVKFSQSLDAELRDKGIRVTAVCPGFTRTEFAQVNGTARLMDQESRRLFQTPEQVAEIALRANDQGRVVVVPGWHNQLAAILLHYLPQPLVSAIVRAGAAKYRVGH
jgi:hypothetical protein